MKLSLASFGANSDYDADSNDKAKGDSDDEAEEDDVDSVANSDDDVDPEDVVEAEVDEVDPDAEAEEEEEEVVRTESDANTGIVPLFLQTRKQNSGIMKLSFALVVPMTTAASMATAVDNAPPPRMATTSSGAMLSLLTGSHHRPNASTHVRESLPSSDDMKAAVATSTLLHNEEHTSGGGSKNVDVGLLPCKQNSPCENEEFCNYAVECRDYNEYCEDWSSNGECDNNPNFMLENCRLACGECNESSGFCMECHSNESFCFDLGLTDDGVRDCESACSTGPTVTPSVSPTGGPTVTLVPTSSENCSNNSPCEDDNKYCNYDDDTCRNNNEKCKYWSSIGDCEIFPDYMLQNCPEACDECEASGFCVECPLNKHFCSETDLSIESVTDCELVCPSTCVPDSPTLEPYQCKRKEFCNC